MFVCAGAFRAMPACATTLRRSSAAVFGPVSGNGPRVLATLLLNSDISGGPNAAGFAQGVLEQAYKASVYVLP